ncbi:outer membrane protein with beta-barrel domain [Arcticibacter tournemirensis]|uniref:Outer membrane beta-barrel protein n=1 Tax=Arcticibacter tournemirensis TaxID=699437 RepID=A0A5M9GYF7_9SPHI|nr:outer membrane beta-barrel protein [Arcticibacter tournemirensis]KAA8479732.1 outer membrane beta-barrel protein [Arcticibacter tournemirensis]TQM50239.1 outer membrane protein with beta-barrel domain [Arcticibacter tournemirensis]
MKTPDENKIDRQFREGLNSSEGNAEFREEDWTVLEKMMNESRPRKNSVIWLYVVSAGIAAVFLLFLILPFLKPVTTVSNRVNKVVGVQHRKSNKPLGKTYAEPPRALSPTNEKKEVDSKNNIEKAVVFERLPFSEISRAYMAGIGRDSNTSAFTGSKISLDSIIPESTPVFAGVEPEKADALDIAADSREERKAATSKVPRISLAVITAPDVNGVNSFANGQVGVNAGIQLSLQLSPKWSLSTGMGYAVKPYKIGSEQFKAGDYSYSYGNRQTDNVVANCKVLDVPVNVNYQFFRNGKSTFSLGTGLSSYFMLREKYTFNYTDNSEYTYRVSNQNKHILGVLNLNATYQREVSKSLNLIMQPYLKLPLTDIGNEGIDLRSVGVAFGVGWNINSRRKQ